MTSYKIINTGTSFPEVCIAMVTYNHDQYITTAIESILNQITTYNYKIIVAEDGSTDATRKILIEYQQKFPEKFKLILQHQNVGAAQNNIDLLSNLEGKYVAALEGDDYWTDPHKLQMQIDFLEQNPSYSACFTNTIYVDREGAQTGICERVPEGMVDITFESLAKQMYMHTPSVVLRFDVVKQFLLKYPKQYSVGDLPLFLTAALTGPIRYIPTNAAAYRTHVGVMSTWGKYVGVENKIQVLETFVSNYDDKLSFMQKSALFMSIAHLEAKLAKNKSLQGDLSFWIYYHNLIKYTILSLLLGKNDNLNLSFKDYFRPLKYITKSILTQQSYKP